MNSSAKRQPLTPRHTIVRAIKAKGHPLFQYRIDEKQLWITAIQEHIFNRCAPVQIARALKLEYQIQTPLYSTRTHTQQPLWYRFPQVCARLPYEASCPPGLSQPGSSLPCFCLTLLERPARRRHPATTSTTVVCVIMHIPTKCFTHYLLLSNHSRLIDTPITSPPPLFAFYPFIFI